MGCSELGLVAPDRSRSEGGGEKGGQGCKGTSPSPPSGCAGPGSRCPTSSPEHPAGGGGAAAAREAAGVRQDAGTRGRRTCACPGARGPVEPKAEGKLNGGGVPA